MPPAPREAKETKMYMYLKKKCPVCNEVFQITKWQRSKIYCTEVCKPKSQKPPTGNPIGRPKAKK